MMFSPRLLGTTLLMLKRVELKSPVLIMSFQLVSWSHLHSRANLASGT